MNFYKNNTNVKTETVEIKNMGYFSYFDGGKQMLENYNKLVTKKKKTKTNFA